ncbi:MAG: hypothetical protein ACRCTZ_05695, partial [Sarcina sp.]
QSGKHMLFLGEYKFKRVYLDGGKEKNTKMYVFVTYYSHLRTITSKEFLESSLFPVHPYEILASKPKLVETEISIDLSNIDVTNGVNMLFATKKQSTKILINGNYRELIPFTGHPTYSYLECMVK